MMHVAIDPSERRQAGSGNAGSGQPAPARLAPAKPVKAAAKPVGLGRPIVLGGLGCLALAGLSVVAYSAMGSLAGPQVVRPNLYQMQKAQSAQASASDWPDLRDGVPVLATAAETAKPQVVQEAAVPVADKAPAVEKIVMIEKPVAEKISTMAAATPGQPSPAPAAARPKAMPAIEPVSVAPPPRAISAIVPTRNAALISPSASQTTRARAAKTSFASLPPEPVAQRPKPTAAVAKPKPVKAAAANPAAAKPVQEASAEPAAAPAAPEPEQSEVFGIKVPSFAPAGRKIAESVEALGNAVKNLPNQF